MYRSNPGSQSSVSSAARPRLGLLKERNHVLSPSEISRITVLIVSCTKAPRRTSYIKKGVEGEKIKKKNQTKTPGKRLEAIKSGWEEGREESPRDAAKEPHATPALRKAIVPRRQRHAKGIEEGLAAAKGVEEGL